MRGVAFLPTIENKGPIPHEFRAAIGTASMAARLPRRVPWNKFAEVASEAKLIARDDLRQPTLADLLLLDDAGFRALFSGSPISGSAAIASCATC